MQSCIVPASNLVTVGVFDHNLSIFGKAIPAYLQDSATNAVRQHLAGSDEISQQVPVDGPGVTIRSVDATGGESDAILVYLDDICCGLFIRCIHNQDTPGMHFLACNRVLTIKDHITSQPSCDKICCIGNLPGQFFICFCLGLLYGF